MNRDPHILGLCPPLAGRPRGERESRLPPHAHGLAEVKIGGSSEGGVSVV